MEPCGHCGVLTDGKCADCAVPLCPSCGHRCEYCWLNLQEAARQDELTAEKAEEKPQTPVDCV
jgi:wyosine [tRNA(Phe)-imidazoG37] synthetase (radical SAM superfamily)